MNKQKVIDLLKEYQDPELGIDIWTLGLIYEIIVDIDKVYIKMTFTTPFCPFGPQIVHELEELLKENGAKVVKIEVVFNPPWKPTEELREMLGI